jgi:NAD(P)H-hydrate epimerase
MPRLLNASQAKRIDMRAREILAIPTLVLMENAGRQVAEQAFRRLGLSKKVAVFCGKGNNGGDGLVAARHLLCRGIKADVFLAGKIKEVKNEARLNLEILLRLKCPLQQVNQRNLCLIRTRLSRYSLIIDALLGVGLKGRVEGFYRQLIALINSSRAYVLAVDIPSGLDATTGQSLGLSVKADETVTFVAKKHGMITPEGRRLCGRVVVKDLGVPL